MRFSTRKVMLEFTGMVAGLLALASAAWACTLHLGTINVCAVPSTTYPGYGCNSNTGDPAYVSDPGVPSNDVTAPHTANLVGIVRGGKIRVNAVLYPDNYQLKWALNAGGEHNDCHESATQAVVSHVGLAAGVELTIPTSSGTGRAWACVNGKGNETYLKDYVTGAPGTLPNFAGITGTAVPFTILASLP